MLSLHTAIYAGHAPFSSRRARLAACFGQSAGLMAVSREQSISNVGASLVKRKRVPILRVEQLPYRQSTTPPATAASPPRLHDLSVTPE